MKTRPAAKETASPLRNGAYLVVLLIAALAGCGPGVDPVAEAAIDRRVALLRQSPLHVAAPTASQPRPFAVGQWTQHKVSGLLERPMFVTTKIVGKEGDAFWFESVIESEVGKSITKELVFVGDRRDPRSIVIRAVRVRGVRGPVVEIPASELEDFRRLFHVVVSWQGQPQEDAVAPAGAFQYCFKGKNVWGPWAAVAAALAWSHPAVPISGLVRAEGVANRHPVSEELVAFGDSGATSELP
jgi:hypothetical protein